MSKELELLHERIEWLNHANEWMIGAQCSMGSNEAPAEPTREAPLWIRASVASGWEDEAIDDIKACFAEVATPTQLRSKRTGQVDFAPDTSCTPEVVYAALARTQSKCIETYYAVLASGQLASAKTAAKEQGVSLEVLELSQVQEAVEAKLSQERLKAACELWQRFGTMRSALLHSTKMNTQQKKSALLTFAAATGRNLRLFMSKAGEGAEATVYHPTGSNVPQQLGSVAFRACPGSLVVPIRI